MLAVTEISNGFKTDCEYAEMIVANCGDDESPNVDVSGWIIDDNSGNFNASGCTGGGITKGHYRLPDTKMWKNVPVGSVIVMYNHDVNCYNLSDTFRIDTTSEGTFVYWIPIGGTAGAPYGKPHVQRFAADPVIIDSCVYCATGIIVVDSTETDTTHINTYRKASAWVNTIGLFDGCDAIQVRCPGCSAANPGEPAFYHGIGYGPATGGNEFDNIAADDHSLGGAVVHTTGTGKKFFMSGDIGRIGIPEGWTVAAADITNTPPRTLGNVDNGLMKAILAHQLNLKCCSGAGIQSRKANTVNTQSDKNITGGASDIKVYPNPANATVYFVFPSSERTTIKLFDISGRVTSEQVVSNGVTATLDVSNYAPGMYIYQVITNTETRSGKIVVGK